MYVALMAVLMGPPHTFHFAVSVLKAVRRRIVVYRPLSFQTKFNHNFTNAYSVNASVPRLFLMFLTPYK